MSRLGLRTIILSMIGIAGCGDSASRGPKIVTPSAPPAAADGPTAPPAQATQSLDEEQEAAGRARGLPSEKQQELFKASNELTQGKELTAEQLKLLREFRGLAGIEESLKKYFERHPEAAAEVEDAEANESSAAKSPDAESKKFPSGADDGEKGEDKDESGN